MIPKLLENNRLFKECIEVLGAEILTWQESAKMSEVFRKMFPIASWGKIDWNKIERKTYIGYNPENIIPALEELLGGSFDKSVFIEWSSANNPIVKTTLDKIIQHFDDVTCVDFEKFIFNPSLGYIVEILTGDEMHVGVIDQEKIRNTKIWQNYFTALMPDFASFSPDTEEEILKRLKNKFGFGKEIVDWKIIQRKEQIEVSNPQSILTRIEKLFETRAINKSVFIAWIEPETYIIRTNLDLTIHAWDIMIKLQPKWIWDIEKTYVMEIVNPTKVMIGLPPKR